MKKISYGVNNFKDLIEENYYFVDKTYVIEDILKDGSYVPAYLRPNGFGKSLFISMLECFFDIDKIKENEHLFDGLKIKESEYFKEFGKYPVIRLDLRTLKYDDFESNYQELKNVMSNIYKEKKYLEDFLDEWELKDFRAIINQTADKLDYERSLKNLSQWLERYHHQKTMIFVDEYDIAIQQGYKNGFYDKIVNLLYSMLDSSLKGNDSLQMGVMTGVLRVQNADIFGGLNNLYMCDLMTKNYNDAFGFTEEETKELLEYYGLELTEEVKTMYGGYNFMGASIYNPWSILNYASKKVLEPYWMNTSRNVLIKKMLGEISERDKIVIEKLIQGESTSFEYDNRTTYKDFERNQSLNIILNLLFAFGFLTFDKEEIDDFFGLRHYYFKIPNEEVRQEFINMCKL